MDGGENPERNDRNQEKKGNDDDDDDDDDGSDEKKGEPSKISEEKKSLNKSGVLYQKEDRKLGSVGIVSQTLSWFQMVDGSTYRVALLVFLLFICTQISRTTSDIFLASWGSDPTKNRFAMYGAIIGLVLSLIHI